MTITIKDLHGMVAFIAAAARSGAISRDDAKAFFGWTDPALASGEFNGSPIVLPPQFDPLYLKFKQSKGEAVETEPRVRISQSTPARTMNKTTFLDHLGQISKTSKDALGRLEFARGGQSESELERAVRLAFKAMDRDRRMCQRDAITAVLADDETRFYWDTVAHALGGGRLNSDQTALMKELRKLGGARQKALDAGTTLGDVLLPIPVSTDVYDLLLTYGAFRDLGVRPMASTKTKFAKITALPTSIFITPTAHDANRTATTDTALAGTSLSDNCNLVVAMIEVSEELLQDEEADLSDVLLRMFIQANAARLDYACFQGDNTDNTTSGAQLGIFQDGSVASASAVMGNTAVTKLQREDFLRVVGTVSAASLQRPCRWFINPSFIPLLLQLKDGNGPQYLLRTPAETGGEWYLCGFKVTWTAQAPSANTPGSKVAAFGQPDAYLVGIREDFELGSSDGAKWAQNIRMIRGLSRARCDMRESTGWATLKLAPN